MGLVYGDLQLPLVLTQKQRTNSDMAIFGLSQANFPYASLADHGKMSRNVPKRLFWHASIPFSSFNPNFPCPNSLVKQYFHAGSLSHPRLLENLTRGAAALFALRQDVIKLYSPGISISTTQIISCSDIAPG